MATMLYKCPGIHDIHGGKFDYTIVEDDQIEAALADGWSRSTPEAKQASDDALSAAKALPTRAELEQKATELQIKFDGHTSDKKLSDLIAATLEA